MHIASGFLSPAAWGTMAAVSGGALAASLAQVGRRLDDRKVPLMGVMGAFVFAAQMVNYPLPLLPMTSGHLGGGFLLGILLGPAAGIVVMASVLVVQALVFQDGGVEALGANLFVMGVVPCLLGGAVRRLWRRPGAWCSAATFVGGTVAVLAGASGVVLLLEWSGQIPATITFLGALAMMDTVHLVIGLGEGLVSVLVVWAVIAVRSEAVWGVERAEAAGEVAS